VREVTRTSRTFRWALRLTHQVRRPSNRNSRPSDGAWLGDARSRGAWSTRAATYVGRWMTTLSKDVRSATLGMQRRPRRSGSPGTGGAGRLGPAPAESAVRAFSPERPEVAVEVHRLEWDEQKELILSGRVDVAYVPQPIRKRGLRLVPLFAERRLAALPADHPLAQRAGLSTADLAGERHQRYLQPAPVPGVSGPQRPLLRCERSRAARTPAYQEHPPPTRWSGQRLEDEAVRASTSRRVRANRFHVQHAAS
jgi:hypothetical protein